MLRQHYNISNLLVIAITVLVGAFMTFAFAEINSDELADEVRQAIHVRHGETPNLQVKAHQDGKVELSGDVETLYTKYRIHDIVTNVPGVTAISNQIVVKPDELRPDKIIQDEIRDYLAINAAIREPDRIKVKVDDAQVFLNGKVSFHHEKVLAQTIASWEPGVRGIVNRIEVLRPEKAVSDENLTKVLNQIMKYQFPLNDKVKFTVNDGVVELKGTAENLWSKRNIEEEFRNVIGIVEVHNYLEVKGLES